MSLFTRFVLPAVSSASGTEFDLLASLVPLPAAAATWMNVLLLLVGMALVFKGGDLFTESAVSIARATRLPASIIGATIVSFATTFPELMVSVTSAVSGVSDFAVGNALGSCCCNIGLIVGTCAIAKGILDRRRGTMGEGIPASWKALAGPGVFMLVSGAAVWIMGQVDIGADPVDVAIATPYQLTRWQGMVLAVLLFVYLAYSIRWAIQARFSAELDASGTARHTTGEMVRQGAWFVVGAVLVIVGSKLLVASAEVLAGRLGVPELIVGLTVLAVGTSLPEYAISLISVVKGHGALGVGNIIGANVLNICWVVASCALLSPLPIQRQTIQLDGPVMLVLMVMLLVASRSADRITMRAGAAVFSVYLAYLAAMFALFR